MNHAKQSKNMSMHRKWIQGYKIASSYQTVRVEKSMRNFRSICWLLCKMSDERMENIQIFLFNGYMNNQKEEGKKFQNLKVLQMQFLVV